MNECLSELSYVDAELRGYEANLGVRTIKHPIPASVSFNVSSLKKYCQYPCSLLM